MFNNFFFRELYRLWDNVEKYSGDLGATNDVTIWRIALHTGLAGLHERMRMHTLTRPVTHMHARKRKHSHTTHTHTHQYVIFITFPQQQWFLWARLIVTLYVHWLSCFFLFFFFSKSYCPRIRLRLTRWYVISPPHLCLEDAVTNLDRVIGNSVCRYGTTINITVFRPSLSW